MADRCSTCGAPIVWAKHAKSGKPAPFDLEPSENGNAWLAADGTYSIVSKAAREREGFEGELRTNHFATCPQASEHRKA